MESAETAELLAPPAIKLAAILSNADSVAIQAIEAKFSELTLEELALRLLPVKLAIKSATESGGRVSNGNRIKMWLINREYSRRSVPPVFRNLPDTNDDDRDQIADSFAIDLDWLATKYPHQVTTFARWQGVFRDRTFHSTSEFISRNYPRREFYWLCTGLGLSEKQQRELHLIKRAELRREYYRLTAGLAEAKINLSAAYHARDGRYKTDDHAATINRRVAVWYVGALAAWKPQQTADLYRAYTGEEISRQIASNIIQQVHRDLPDSKPRRKLKP